MISIHLNLLSEERKSLIHDIGLMQGLQTSAMIILGAYLAILGILWGGKMFLETERAQYSEIIQKKQATLDDLRGKYQSKTASAREERQAISSMQSAFVLWSETLRELASVSPKDIHLLEATFHAGENTFLLRGVAANREALILYRDALLAVEGIETLEAPVSTFTQKENLSFQFTGSFHPHLLGSL